MWRSETLQCSEVWCSEVWCSAVQCSAVLPQARLQYGLFLKGIGLSLEDALKFFRGEFTKRTDVDVDKFEKEYSYGIRYNYGKEGKKKNWQPYDCMRIIMETVGPGENHGCPFRHHEARTVRQRVEAYGLKKEQVDPIMAKIEEGHYQIACGLHYSAVHLKELSTGAVTHPNQWYMESRYSHLHLSASPVSDNYQGFGGGRKGRRWRERQDEHSHRHHTCGCVLLPGTGHCRDLYN